MNKTQYHKKMLMYFLLASGLTVFEVNYAFARNQEQKIQPATGVERTIAVTKHKIMGDKVKPAVTEAAEAAEETQKAIIALEKKDAKEAETLLKGVSAKLETILKNNPGMALVPADVEADVYDFTGSNQAITNAIAVAGGMLKQGKLQGARKLLSGMASEIQVTTTNIPLGTYPAAIKAVIPLIEAGKIDQAVVDLNSVLETLEVNTDVMPLPVLRAEELLTVAAGLEHTDDLSKDKNRVEIKRYTDAAKEQLERAQLLGYGDKSDYKPLYQEIDAIHKTLFTQDSAAAWKKIKDELTQFKARLKDLGNVVERVGHPPK